jgi:hypothetical protein
MISPEQIVLRLVIAAILGGLVGVERERLEWAAGMRTHALVSLGSALFMVVSAFGFSDILGEQHVILDPSRVAAQVVSGIGFLGAGTIILRREIVKGLTTAASVWAVAAVGLAVGGGMFLAGVETAGAPGELYTGASRRQGARRRTCRREGKGPLLQPSPLGYGTAWGGARGFSRLRGSPDRRLLRHTSGRSGAASR